jgi:radical SAM protein with 4Fe4S-binding SPASM domain
VPEFGHVRCDHLFHCGAGNGSFCVSYNGFFRLCSSLWSPDCVYDLRGGSLAEAWFQFVPKVRDMRSENREFLQKCRVCPLINLCLWCPAHACLETGAKDAWCEYFCGVAHARAQAVQQEGRMAERYRV